MSREQIEIKVVTYKEERLNYFTALYEKATNKFDRLFKRHKDAPYLSDEFQKMSDAGHEAEFLGDVVKMLKQSEVIRCKDCKHFYQDGNVKVCRHWNCHSTEDNAYCSYAKMKGGAE